MVFARLYATVLMVVGLPLLAGGGWLLVLGGSVYFAALGAALIGTGALLWRGSRWSVPIYAATLMVTWGWALADAGIDLWVLSARLGFLLVLGLGFVLPWVRRGLVSGPAVRHGPALTAASVLLVLGATALTGGVKGDPVEIIGSAGPDLPAAAGTPDPDWRNYGNGPGGTRYSPLAQIDTRDIGRLALAWTYRTGDYPPPTGPLRRLEVTPLAVAGNLYLCSARNRIVALDAGSGRQRWAYDPHIDQASIDPGSSCRGVAYYRDAAAGADGSCAQRIYEATEDARLVAVDALTGQPCAGFGTHGEVNLTQALGAVIPGYVSVSSAPVVVHDKVIVGSRISDGQSVGEPGGAIRAYDARTGALSWVFDPGDPADQQGPLHGKTLVRGTPNSWAPMSADPALGLVYVPTGNATPDYWGGYRTALDDRTSSAVIAIDVETGRARWTFQTAHHDLWDYDVASQPTLFDLPGARGTVPALLQPTKRGQLFLLDRRNGAPLAQVEERPVPHRGVAGERVAPTQPFSTGMPAFDGLPIAESGLWGLTPFDALWCHIRYRQAAWGGTMTPPADRFYLQMPSGLGGMNWGSATVDTDRALAFVPWNTMLMRNRLVPRARADRMGLKPVGPGGEVGGAVAQAGTPFAAIAAPFMSPLGVPCQAPPYGRLSAVDLHSRQIVWTRRLGLASANRLAGVRVPLPIAMGAPIAGGALATRGGLVFIGAVGDDRLRAFDSRTGQLVWQARLPAAANATPMSTLAPDGRQMIVVAAGGHPMMQTDPGDFIMAFALK